MTKRLPWFEIALGIVFLSAYIFAAFSDAYNLPNRWFIRDDAYYYYKVAQNISEGHGSTFDGIHPSNGYHPLWMLVCIPIFALARYDLILPLRLLVLVTGALQFGTAILLYRLIRSTISTPVAVLAALYWSFDSNIQLNLYKTGVESSIALFFIMLLLVLVLRFERGWRNSKVSAGQIALLGIVTALVVFSRLDLIFFGLLMGLWIVLRGSPMRYLLPLDLLALFVSALLAFVARLGFPGYYEASEAALLTAILAMAVQVPVFYIAGLYTPPSSWTLPTLLLRLVIACAAGSVTLLLILFAGAALGLLSPVPRAALFYHALLSFGFVVLIRLAAYLFRSSRVPQAGRAPLQQLRLSARAWLTEGAVFYGIVGGSLALYMLWSKLTFGVWSPVSGEIKRWWGTFWISVYGGPAKSLLKFLTLDNRSDFDAWRAATLLVRGLTARLPVDGAARLDTDAWQSLFLVVLVATFILIVAFLLLRRQRAARSVIQAGMIPLFVGAWFQVLFYNATGYASMKEWYWLLQPLLLVILGALLIDTLVRLFPKQWLAPRVVLWASVVLFALQGGRDMWVATPALYPYGRQGSASPYPDLVPFLEQHTPPGAIIGMTGGGNVGYFLHDRTIVNMDGLINSPAYFAALRSGTGSDMLYQDGMRYVFANRDILESNPYRGQYENRLVPIIDWGGKDVMKLLPVASE